MLQHARSKVDFSIAEGVYMIPSDMNLQIKKKIEFFNNKILVSEPGMKLGMNSSVNYTPPQHREKKKPTPHHIKQHQHSSREISRTTW